MVVMLNKLRKATLYISPEVNRYAKWKKDLKNRICNQKRIRNLLRITQLINNDVGIRFLAS